MWTNRSPLDSKSILAIRVLLVEDNQLDQLLATAILRKSGYHVEYVGDGLEALDRIAGGERFDLVLVDYELPTINGIELTEQLRSGGFRQPIAAVSAGSEVELIDDWRNAGCSEFLAKPYTPRQLREFVDQALSRRQSRRGVKHALEFAIQST